MPFAPREAAPWRRDRAARFARTPQASCLPAQFPEQPRARQAPVAPDGADRNVEHMRNLFEAQAAEEAELDDTALARVELFEALQRIIQCHQVGAPAGRQLFGFR